MRDPKYAPPVTGASPGQTPRQIGMLGPMNVALQSTEDRPASLEATATVVARASATAVPDAIDLKRSGVVTRCRRLRRTYAR
jgi:hypothetical protein